ncbi:nuclear transport factor 2-like isoform X2 [Diospyros lotus]|uniref:nuclear transport factor 2-like isoform X2 n=1 Tax=Diospyros lotus TaxID=55363 RepID=UPI0022579315|nr:nuclear transport factor 2-like isoform X2 [Diospyros lotus]
MAMETVSLHTPPAQVVGNAFVEQYYHILYQSPELVHRFYQDSSMLSRPETNGVMTSVTTMKGINDKICSFDYKNCKAEIKTADAQESYKDGVIVLVTGCLTGPDNIRRKFTQTFFLAPQDKGYFVLNDVFRYVEDSEPLENNKVAANANRDIPIASQMPDPEPVHPPTVDSMTSVIEEAQNVEEQKVHDPVDNERQAVSEKEVTMRKGGSVPTKVYVPANTSRVAPTRTEKQSLGSVSHPPVPEALVPSASDTVNALESGNAEEEVEGYSVYVRNLPINVTVTQLEVAFKKFGPIKQGSVQVRSNKQQGFCFGFVEFHSLSSMNDAIQASPVTVGDRQAIVEMKRTTTRVGSGRGRFPPGRGGFRSDNFRGRGNYGGGRGYGRSDFSNRGDFSGRGRGGPGGYQQGRGRGGRRGGLNQNTVPA